MISPRSSIPACMEGPYYFAECNFAIFAANAFAFVKLIVTFFDTWNKLQQLRSNTKFVFTFTAKFAK